MNPVIVGQLRHVLTTIGGILAAKGYISAADIEMYVGILVTVAGFAWSAYDKPQKGKARATKASRK
jgi:hypothetical protein